MYHGGGDEWLQEDEEDDGYDIYEERLLESYRDKQAFLSLEAEYDEARTRLRTAYLCKDMVRPLSTPLDDRITALALTINEQR